MKFRSAARGQRQNGGRYREVEAPAEPLRELAHIDLAARREPRRFALPSH